MDAGSYSSQSQWPPNVDPYSGCALDHAPKTEPSRSRYIRVRKCLSHNLLGMEPLEGEYSYPGDYAADVGCAEDWVIERVARLCGKLRINDEKAR